MFPTRLTLPAPPLPPQSLIPPRPLILLLRLLTHDPALLIEEEDEFTIEPGEGVIDTTEIYLLQSILLPQEITGAILVDIHRP